MKRSDSYEPTFSHFGHPRCGEFRVSLRRCHLFHRHRRLRRRVFQCLRRRQSRSLKHCLWFLRYLWYFSSSRIDRWFMKALWCSCHPVYDFNSHFLRQRRWHLNWQLVVPESSPGRLLRNTLTRLDSVRVSGSPSSYVFLQISRLLVYARDCFLDMSVD